MLGSRHPKPCLTTSSSLVECQIVDIYFNLSFHCSRWSKPIVSLFSSLFPTQSKMLQQRCMSPHHRVVDMTESALLWRIVVRHSQPKHPWVRGIQNCAFPYSTPHSSPKMPFTAPSASREPGKLVCPTEGDHDRSPTCQWRSKFWLDCRDCAEPDPRIRRVPQTLQISCLRDGCTVCCLIIVYVV